MTTAIRLAPATLEAELGERLACASFATFGHYLEEGFVDPAIRRFAGDGALVGTAFTVRLPPADSTLLHHAVQFAGPGHVIVIDTGGDRRHAPVGEVLAEAMAARGVEGVIVDGALTDLDAIEATGIRSYARGTSLLTTKLHGLEGGGVNVPVTCGGVPVAPGDVVLGDRNGLLVADRSRLLELLDLVLEDDAEEPALVAEIRAGGQLGALAGADDIVRSMDVEREGEQP